MLQSICNAMENTLKISRHKFRGHARGVKISLPGIGNACPDHQAPLGPLLLTGQPRHPAHHSMHVDITRHPTDAAALYAFIVLEPHGLMRPFPSNAVCLMTSNLCMKSVGLPGRI